MNNKQGRTNTFVSFVEIQSQTLNGKDLTKYTCRAPSMRRFGALIGHFIGGGFFLKIGTRWCSLERTGG